jgi:uncharacterized membrane-anchored protein
MQAWTDFFSTDYGLMSAAVLAITIGMAVFFVRFFVRNMNEDEAREKLRQKN